MRLLLAISYSTSVKSRLMGLALENLLLRGDLLPSWRGDLEMLSVLAALGVKLREASLLLRMDSDCFLEESLGENVHSLMLLLVISYFSSSCLRRFSRIQISFLRTTSPVTVNLVFYTLVGVKGQILSYYFSASSLSFCSFCLAFSWRDSRSFMMLEALSK